MSRLSISLGPSLSFRLFWPDGHHIDFPRTEKGVEILYHVLFSYAVEYSKIGTSGTPTQSQVNAWLIGEAWEKMQLAGDSRRWQDVEKATGVKVRRLDSKGFEKEPTLEDLGL